MGSGKTNGRRRNSAILFSAVTVALLLTSSLIILNNSSDYSSATTLAPKITYYANNGSTGDGSSRLIKYSGIASTEYNPEYWEGTGYVPVSKELFLKKLVDNGSGTYTINYESIGTNQVVGSREVYVYEGGAYRIYDPYRDGSSNNWVGPAVTNAILIGDITLTIKSGVDSDIVLPNDIVINSVTCSNSNVKKSDANSYTITCPTIDTDTTATVNVSLKVNKVFAGWNTSSNGSGSYYLPGDVVPYAQTTSLYAMWVTPDIFMKNTATAQKSGGVIVNDVYCHPYYVTTSATGLTDSDITSAGYTIKKTSDSGFGSDYQMYKRIHHLSGDISFNTSALPTGTYRSESITDKAIVNVYNTICKINGDVIFDNVRINGNNTSKHGVNDKSAIFACGHILIMGTGLENRTVRNGTQLDVSTGKGIIQVFGGDDNSHVTTPLKSFLKESESYKKKIVMASQDDLSERIATCVIIHSGIYYNVFGGSFKGNIGSNGNYLSTYTVLRGGIVTDTAAGGSAVSGTVFGGPETIAMDDDDDDETNANNVRTGGTFVYAVGNFFTPGDNWQDMTTGFYDRAKISGVTQVSNTVLDRGRFYIKECSTLQGGGHATVNGSSHVFISNDASIWDAQGGGREDPSKTVNTFLEITGNSTVRRLACGIITNAADSSGKDCVRHVHIYVDGEANVSNVFGGGFDTWKAPTNRTMVKGSVEITVNGGTVGDIYGGGYRGSIGTPGSVDLLSVTIDIKGGEITGNVYGGGSGGVDKAKHDLDGKKITDSEGEGYKYATGKSYIYGNVEVKIEGGTVHGDVYGGGKSIPKLSEYSADNWSYSSFINETEDAGLGNNVDYVASVVGSTKVSVTGGTIKGSVYGGGKGIEMTSTTVDEVTTWSIDGDYTTFRVIKANGDYYDLPWFQDGEATITYDTTSTYIEKYLRYARVVGDTSVTVNMTNDDDIIQGSVYGGGKGGIVEKYTGGSYTGDKALNGNIKVEIIAGNISGSVFGGGYGRSGYTATNGNRVVLIRGGKIQNSVYGSSSDGNDVLKSKVVITDGEIGVSVFGGGFMGTLTGSTEVYIGYAFDNNADIFSEDPDKTTSGNHSVEIGDSIFAGADVKEGGAPYSATLVTDGGSVKIYGASTDIDFSGSIMADGNSCLTGGTTDMLIENFNPTEKLTGIHRADTVKIINSNIRISGKEARIHSDVIKEASLFRIGHLILQKDTVLSIEQPAEDIHKFSSLNESGDATVMSYPSNKIVFLTGSSFYIRTDNDTSAMTYGTVTGYTAMAVTDQATYGAYILGNLSTGGFVIMKDGKYVSAGITDFDEGVSSTIRCWFISGIENKTTTLELAYNESGGSSYSVSTGLDITKLQKSSFMRYVGGNYVPAVTGYSIVTPGYTTSDKFGLKIGSWIENGRSIAYGESDGGSGYVEAPLFYETNDQQDLLTGTISGTAGSKSIAVTNDNGVYRFNMELWGHPENVTLNLGYVVIRLYEINEVDIGNNETVEVTVNQVDIRVNLYVKGSGIPTTQNVILNAADIGEGGSHTYAGSTDVMIASTFTGRNFVIENAYIGRFYSTGFVVDGGLTFDDLKVSCERNSGNTYGWKSANTNIRLTSSSHSNITVGTLSGGYAATLRFALDNYHNESTEEYDTGYKIECSITNPNDPEDTSGMTIYVKVILQMPVTITFEKITGETLGTHDVKYGMLLDETDCPLAGDDFIGWYTDTNFRNSYDFSTPVTSAFTLYARYSYVVTFDLGDGTSYRIYLPQDENAKVSKPSDPMMYGYKFNEWLKQNSDPVEWDANNKYPISGSTTFYASWIAKDITLEYSAEGVSPWSITDGVDYGDSFGIYAKQIAGHQVPGLAKWRCGSVDIRSETIVDIYTVNITWRVDGTVTDFRDVDWNSDTKTIIGYISLVGVISGGKSIEIAYSTTPHETPPSWSSTETIWSSSVEEEGGIRTYSFTMIVPGLTYKGYNVDYWTNSGSNYGSGNNISIDVNTVVAEDALTGDEIITVKSYSINGGSTIIVSDTLIEEFSITLTAHWVQINYVMTINDDIHGIITIVSINSNTSPTQSMLTNLHYGDVVTLRFDSNPLDITFLSSWTSSGQCVLGTPLAPSTTATITGDCTVSIVETYTRHFRINVEYIVDDEGNKGQIHGHDPDLYALFIDEDSILGSEPEKKQLVYQSIDGNTYCYYSDSVDTPYGEYEIYVLKSGTYYLLGSIDERGSTLIELHTIYFVKHDNEGNVYDDLTVPEHLAGTLEGMYGDENYVTVVPILDSTGQTLVFEADEVIADSGAYIATHVGNDIYTLHAGVNKNMRVSTRYSETLISSENLIVSVEKRPLFVVSYDNGNNTYNSSKMNDMADDIRSITVTAVNGLLTMTITFEDISENCDYSIDYEVNALYGTSLPVSNVLSSVTAPFTKTTPGLMSTLSINSVSHMAKRTSDTEIQAIIKGSSWRRYE